MVYIYFILLFILGYIYYDQFFQFVCILTLLGFNQVISLILASCKVYSNLFINYDQIIEFVNVFDKDHRADIYSFMRDNYQKARRYKKIKIKIIFLYNL